jgi:restriction system protein
MRGQQGRKGVFITTSSFSRHTMEFADGIEGLVVVDGRCLANLMLEFELAVQAKAIKIPAADYDYFNK